LQFRFFISLPDRMVGDRLVMNQQQRPKRNLIYLAGFMGSGKSTIGPILANTLGFDFVDIDKLVEKGADKKLIEIFASEGEHGFRARERATLEQVSTMQQCVVSLGGGTIANEENFRLIRQSGIIVYLQLPPEEIYQRVHRRTDRPLLTDVTGAKLTEDALQQRISELFERRDEFYSRADVIIRTDRKKVGTTVDEIVRRLHGLIDS